MHVTYISVEVHTVMNEPSADSSPLAVAGAAELRGNCAEKEIGLAKSTKAAARYLALELN